MWLLCEGAYTNQEQVLWACVPLFCRIYVCNNFTNFISLLADNNSPSFKQVTSTFVTLIQQYSSHLSYSYNINYLRMHLGYIGIYYMSLH